MKKLKSLLLVAIILFAFATLAHLYWLSRLNGNEIYPEDEFLQTASNKTALIIVAHDDDAIGCAGTTSKLTSEGWKVHFLTFYGTWHPEVNPIRKAEVARVAEIQKLASTTLIDFMIQRYDTLKEPWMPIPYAKLSEYMYVDSVKVMIEAAIEKYKPSVLFTLDNVIGGYGNSEHVCVSKSVLDVCLEKKSNPEFSVERIYQAVFPPTLNENVLRKLPVYIAAKKVYHAEGSPVPTVEVTIYDQSKEKKEVMLAYKSQHRNLKKFWPYYHFYPHWLYFRIFDKEYFHVISIKG